MNLEQLQTQLVVEQLKSESIGTMHINLQSGQGIQIREIALFQENAVFDELDEKEKPTGQTFTAPLITLNNGKELQLTDEEYKFFKTLWNRKVLIDSRKFNIVAALDKAQYPQTEKPKGQND